MELGLNGEGASSSSVSSQVSSTKPRRCQNAAATSEPQSHEKATCAQPWYLASALELVAHDCVYRYVRYQLLRTSEIRDNPHWQADSGGSEGSMCKRRMRSDQL